MEREKVAVALVLVLVAIAVVPAVRSARGLGSFGAWSAPRNLGAGVNTLAIDGCPFIVKGDDTLYFASNRAGGLGGLDLYVTYKADDGSWSVPLNLGGSINTPGNEFCPMVSTDGHSLYFVSNRPGGVGGDDLYVAHRQRAGDDTGWQDVTNMGVVNSPANDFTPTILGDDGTGHAVLYFSSNRPGGVGGVDIYQSQRGDDGTFGAATLVPELSTAKDDERPNVRHDGKELFFDSNRDGSAGYDLWVSTRDDATRPWSAPTQVPGVNSNGVEGRPTISWDGATLYFMSNRAGGFGVQDIYVSIREKARGSD